MSTVYVCINWLFHLMTIYGGGGGGVEDKLVIYTNSDINNILEDLLIVLCVWFLAVSLLPSVWSLNGIAQCESLFYHVILTSVVSQKSRSILLTTREAIIHLAVGGRSVPRLDTHGRSSTADDDTVWMSHTSCYDDTRERRSTADDDTVWMSHKSCYDDTRERSISHRSC